METDRPGPTDDEIAVRLRWPGEPVATDLSGPRSAPAPLEDEVSSRVAWPVHATEVVSASDEPARPGRGLMEAYDRLGDRVLERLRALREDIDADLAAMRSELASLRQAVDDVGDRVQLRQLRASIDELRGDVSGLRRAVIEWPELEQVSSDVAGLRADLADLLGRQFALEQASGDLAGLRADLSELVGRESGMSRGDDEPAASEVIRAELAEIRRLIDASTSLPALAPLIEEVIGLREDVSSLRHRIALRASGSTVELSEEQLQRLIVALEARVLGQEELGRRTRAR